MIIMTTAMIEGHNIKVDKGRVVDEVIMGAAEVVRDFFASITDVIGGSSGFYESKLADADEAAMSQLRKKHGRWALIRLSVSILIMKWLVNLCLRSRSVARRS